jgi:hypothetical protein
MIRRTNDLLSKYWLPLLIVLITFCLISMLMVMIR